MSSVRTERLRGGNTTVKGFTSWGPKKKSRKRAIGKPKIRWGLLGLQDPAAQESTTSIDDIRQQIISVAGQGLSPRSRSDVTEPSGQTAPVPTAAYTRRRGATT